MKTGMTKSSDGLYQRRYPANGSTVEGKFFLIFNALGDTAVAMVIISLVSSHNIPSLCIRLTFLATNDEDLREIGVMKAIGISKKDIKKVYLNKYRIMSVAAGIIGYVLILCGCKLINGNMRLYISSNFREFAVLAIPYRSTHFSCMLVMYCKRVLKRIDKISAVEALT